jgi:deoxyribonuclease V
LKFLIFPGSYVDGNGIAHPRKMGLASYVGVVLDICTIGCAKKPFYPFVLPSEKKGAYTLFRDERKDNVGICLRSRSRVKPIFVSPGHRIDLMSAMQLVLGCSKFRIPEPLREAHKRASKIF